MANFQQQGFISSTPSNSPYFCTTIDQQQAEIEGGQIEYFVAKQALAYGDLVYIDPLSTYADKNLESSLYGRAQIGLVQGGVVTDMKASNDNINLNGVIMAQAGQLVMVLTYGIGFATIDANVNAGQPFTSGRTTAGRIRGDLLSSYAYSSAGLTIFGAGSALAKTVNPTQGID